MSINLVLWFSSKIFYFSLLLSFENSKFQSNNLFHAYAKILSPNTVKEKHPSTIGKTISLHYGSKSMTMFEIPTNDDHWY